MPVIERPKIEAAITKPFRVEINTQSGALLNARSGAPIPLEWKLTWKGKGLAEGRLEYSLWDEGRLLGSFSIEDVVISGDKIFRTMLPGVRSPEELDTVDVRLKFVTAEETYELDPQVIKIPQVGSRHVTILLCDAADVSLSPESSNLLDSLSVSQFEPDKRELVTQNARYRVQDLPEDPLAFCGFDVVAITSQAFRELRQEQLDALRQWVEAGGSLFLSAGSGLLDRHLKFLNELGREDLAETPFVRGEKGALAGVSAPLGSIGFRRGLGQVTLTFGLSPPISDDRTSEQRRLWERIAATVWRVRPERLTAYEDRTSWDSTTEQVNGGIVGFGINQFRPRSRHHVRNANIGDWVLAELLPERVQVVPLWLLASLLGVYLALIGPAEYFGLGLIRLRRMTWILFPVTTFGFTGGILWLSNRYMYSEVQSRAVTFVDVIDDGKVVRENRIELLFTNAYRNLTHDVQRAYFTPLDLEAFGGNLAARNAAFEERSVDPWDDIQNQRQPWRKQGSRVESVTYAGRIPGRYKVIQNVPQWTPHLNRWMSIAPMSARVDFNWTAWTKDDFRNAERRVELASAIRKTFGESVTAVLFRGQPGAGEASRGSTDRTFVLVDDSGTSPLEFLSVLSCGSSEGLGRYLSRQSPAGGPHFEDLPVLDTSRDEWLLVILVPTADDYMAYRRLYR